MDSIEIKRTVHNPYTSMTRRRDASKTGTIQRIFKKGITEMRMM